MENRNLSHYILVVFKGMAMGAADVVPGVSGGTIAFISGIYEELIASINNINLDLFKIWKKEGFKAMWSKLNGNFLLSLCLGIGISLLSLAKLVSWLLENQPILIWAFFFGLVVASVLLVGKEVKNWGMATISMFIIGTFLAYYITVLPPSENVESLPYLFFSGALAICAMILPGISGAFILVLLGSYKTIIDSLHTFNLKIIIVVGLGVVFGLLSFARLLKWLFSKHRNMTLAVLAGFILGSLNKIWPWKTVLETRSIGDKIITVDQNVSPFAFEGDSQILLAIIAAIIGFSIIFILEKVAKKE